MTGEDNTKICNNKTLLGTCMLMYIVCMLSVGDVLGMEKSDEMNYVPVDYLIQQLENNHTMYEDFKKILTRDKRFNIKYKKRCRCCDTDKIDFEETTMHNQNKHAPCSKSLEWYMGNTFYYDKTDDSIKACLLSNFKACTNLDDFITMNIKAPK